MKVIFLLVYISYQHYKPSLQFVNLKIGKIQKLHVCLHIIMPLFFYYSPSMPWIVPYTRKLVCSHQTLLHTEQSEHCDNKVVWSISWVMHMQSLMIHTYQLSRFQRDSPEFWSKISCCPAFFPFRPTFFYWILGTNLSLNLIILAIFIKFVRMPCFQIKNPAF